MADLIEFEYYSVVYFKGIAKFDTVTAKWLLGVGLIQCFVDVSDVFMAEPGDEANLDLEHILHKYSLIPSFSFLGSHSQDPIPRIPFPGFHSQVSIPRLGSTRGYRTCQRNQNYFPCERKTKNQPASAKMMTTHFLIQNSCPSLKLGQKLPF